MTDVWEIETSAEKRGSEALDYLYGIAKRGDKVAREMIGLCFLGDNWKTIRERMETEGSAWYVWYMDGVRTFLTLMEDNEKKLREGLKK